MKIKIAATILLCSFAIFCSEVSAAGPLGQLLQSGSRSSQAAAPIVENFQDMETPAPVAAPMAGSSQDMGALMAGSSCGCETTPSEGCGCEATTDEGCGCRQPVRGLLSKLRRGNDTGCGCEAATPSCGCRNGNGLKGLLERMAGQVTGDCGCGPTCEAPAPAVDPSCGCEVEAAPSCGDSKGGLLGKLSSRGCGGGCLKGGLLGRLKGGCGCGDAAPVADCGCAAEPAPAPAPSCGCKNGGLLGRLKGGCGCGDAAPVADCGCAAEPAPAPSCGCKNGGLLGRLKGGCGCGDAAPVADCGCAAQPAPAPSCGCKNGGLRGRLASGGRGCGDAASSCGCDSAASGGFKLGNRLKAGCGRCGKSSCDGDCNNRSGLTLLNRLRGDRIVRDTSNCGRCMPACPQKDSGCNSGCSSCGDSGAVHEYHPSMEVTSSDVKAAPAAIPTTEGSMATAAVSKLAQPVVDSSAFTIGNQK